MLLTRCLPRSSYGLANTTATLGSFYWLGFETSGLSPDKKRLAWLGAQRLKCGTAGIWRPERSELGALSAVATTVLFGRDLSGLDQKLGEHDPASHRGTIHAYAGVYRSAAHLLEHHGESHAEDLRFRRVQFLVALLMALATMIDATMMLAGIAIVNKIANCVSSSTCGCILFYLCVFLGRTS